MRRGPFSLRTVPGLAASGLLAGAVLAAVMVVWRLILIDRGLVPDEPVATAPAGQPEPELRERTLLIPVKGVAASALADNFADSRGGGTRVHQAIDIMAPRGTPVLAVEDGRVIRLHRGGAGGITVYQLDGAQRYGYYYAHLDRYAEGLAEGQRVTRGDVLGFVGTTGNAPPGAPHLHFAIYEVEDPKRPSRGKPIDPFPLWR